MSCKPHEPTPESRAQVEALTGYGIVQDEIAAYLGIDAKTLRKHYRAEIDGAVVKANALVARSLHKMATEGGNVAAAIFWLKARAGWRETIEHKADVNIHHDDAEAVTSKLLPELARGGAASATDPAD